MIRHFQLQRTFAQQFPAVLLNMTHESAYICSSFEIKFQTHLFRGNIELNMIYALILLDQLLEWGLDRPLTIAKPSSKQQYGRDCCDRDSLSNT
ncbi:hypothetical protein D3C77_713360 [compost metagenome]